MRLEELAQEYIKQTDEARRCQNRASVIKERMANLAPHKVGELITWHETGRTKNEGTTWKPKFVNLPDRDVSAVLNKVDVYVSPQGDVEFKYSFVLLKKDGTPSCNTIYPRHGYTWTGKHVKIY